MYVRTFVMSTIPVTKSPSPRLLAVALDIPGTVLGMSLMLDDAWITSVATSGGFESLSIVGEGTSIVGNPPAL